MNRYFIIILGILLSVSFVVLRAVYLEIPREFAGYQYKVKARAYIEVLSVRLGDHSFSRNIVGQYGIGSLEENYEGLWTLDRLVRSVEKPGYYEVYSKCYTFKALKQFHFYEYGFTLLIVKQYLFDSVNLNNQIIFDCLNWDLFNVSVISCNVPYEIEIHPYGSYPSELQFNLNGSDDRAPTYHRTGQIERILFNCSM